MLRLWPQTKIKIQNNESETSLKVFSVVNDDDSTEMVNKGHIGAASVRQRICDVRYLKHLLVWQVIFFVGSGVGIWNSITTSDGTTYIGLADLGAWAGSVLIVAPILALISWCGSGLFSSKPLDLDE